MRKPVSRPRLSGVRTSEPVRATGDPVLWREPSSRAEAARYLAEFAGELCSLAKQSRFDLLAYMLDMARMEATRMEEEIKERKPDA